MNVFSQSLAVSGSSSIFYPNTVKPLQNLPESRKLAFLSAT